MHENNMIYGIAKLLVKKEDNNYIIMLKEQPIKQQNDFSKALFDFFSKCDEPRYVITNKCVFGYNFKYSFDCPSLFDKNKKTAQCICEKLEKIFGQMDAIYSNKNKLHIMQSKQKSCAVQQNEIVVQMGT